MQISQNRYTPAMNRFVSCHRRFSKLLVFVGLCYSLEFPVENTICNNVEYLCDLPVNEILFGMVHNAMSSPSAGFFLFANHMNDPIVESLDEGYRGLSLDLCNCNGDLIFCHGGSEVGCGIGERDPLQTFTKINEWITANPNNVIMIWLQINENAGDPISLDDVERLIYDVPIGSADREFVDRLYQREDDNDWAKLSTLIQNEKQVLFFYMGGPDGREESIIGIHYFYEYGMSTDWSYESVSELRESMMDGCKIQRDSSNTRDFFMINSFVTKKLFGYQMRPSRDAAEEVNDGEFLQPLMDVCERTQKSKVNIVSVDFWKSGDLINYVNDWNSKLSSAHNSKMASLMPSSSYILYPEPSIALEENVQRPSVTTVPGRDNAYAVSSAASRPWSDSGRLHNNYKSVGTELRWNYDDGSNTPSTLPSSKPSSSSAKFKFSDNSQLQDLDHKSKEEEAHSGDNVVGSSSEEGLDKSMRSSSVLNSDPESDSLSEQENREDMIIARSWTNPLMNGDDKFGNGNSDSATASFLLSSSRVASILIISFLTFQLSY